MKPRLQALGTSLAGTAINSLAAALQGGVCCPVVGAGLSVDLGAKTWHEMFADLATNLGFFSGVPARKIRSRQKEIDLHFLGEFLKNEGNQSLLEMQRQLYTLSIPETWASDINFRSRAVHDVASLCIEVAKQAPEREFHAISYNYDVFLEEAIIHQGHYAVALSRGGARRWKPLPSKRDKSPLEIRIIHPHGIIPRPCNIHTPLPQHSKFSFWSDEVVLAPSEYFEILDSKNRLALHWQATAFRAYNCLFYGFSFSDLGVRYLLLHSDLHGRHPMPDILRHVALITATDIYPSASQPWHGLMHAKRHAANNLDVLCLGGFKSRTHLWKQRFIKLLLRQCAPAQG